MLRIVKRIIIGLFPGLYDRYLLEKRFSYSHYRRLQSIRLSSIRKKGVANVTFILSSLPMWRLEDVVSLLKEDNRFRVSLVICPFATYSEEQQAKCVKELIQYCSSKGWNFINRATFHGNIVDRLDPDIIFYPQLYNHLFHNELDCELNLDRLIAYVPYGLTTVSGEWMYNSRFMNTVWKLYFQTKLHLQFAKRHSYNHARNMEVVGDPHAISYFVDNHSYSWKGYREKKRLIWAPHFSIGDHGYLHRASFLWLNESMWKLAEEYKDRLQIVFKPHPRLLTELYRHPNWGKEKADAYYEMWRNGSNTQVETGEYVDLFCTSDAMIHDCGSFTAEYHFTGKPVAFASNDFHSLYEGLDAFGKKCMDLHYHVESVEDIRHFIETVVLGDQDQLMKERDAFREKYLKPIEGTTFHESVYHSLVKNVFRK